MSRKLSEAEKKAARIAEIERFRTGPVMAYINAGHTRHQAIEHFRLPAHVVHRIVTLVTGKKADGRDKPSRGRDNPARLAQRLRERQARADAKEAKNASREAIIRTMLAEGKTNREIAAAIGLSTRRVPELARRFGIPYEPPVRVKVEKPKPTRPVRIAVPRFHVASRDMRQTPFVRDEEAEISRRSRISTLITADRNNRRPPPVTLPRLSILEEVID